MMGQDIAFTDCQIPVEDIKEFALHATNIAQIKYARPSSPTNVLDSIIIEVLFKFERVKTPAGCAEYI
jgi:hypothetical protein